MSVLRAVLAAVDDGCVTAPQVADRTGLPVDVVEAAVDHLRRTGHLPPALRLSCPAAGCGTCALAAGCRG